MASSKDDTHNLNCITCFKPCSSLRVLSCFHAFCDKCLVNLASSDVSREECEINKFILCPICENKTIFLDDLTTLESLSTADDPQCKPTTGDTTDRPCEACRRDNENVKAIVWCKDCSEALCENCKTCHKRNKFTRYHDVIDIKLVSCLLSCLTVDMKCTGHTEKDLDIFCFDHRQLCCVLGAATDHKHCQYIKPLNGILDNVSEEYYPKVLQMLERMTKGNTELLVEMERNVSELVETEFGSLLKISKLVQDTKKKLDDLELAFQTNISQVCRKHKASLIDRIKEMKQLETNLMNSSKTAKSFIENTSKQRAFIALERLKSQIISHYEHVRFQLTDAQNVKVEIEIDESLFNAVQKLHLPCEISESSQKLHTLENINSIGATADDLFSFPSKYDHFDEHLSSDMAGSLVRRIPCEKTENTTGNTVCEEEDHRSALRVWETDLTMKCSVTEVKAVLSPVIRNQTINPTCGAFLFDGRLLLIDGTSHEVILFDENYNYVTSCKVGGVPKYITVNNSFVYLALQENLLLTGKMESTNLSIQWQIKFPNETKYVVVNDDVIMAGTNDGITTMRNDGTIIERLKIDLNGSVLAISPSRKMIYYTKADTVICADMSGAKIFQYSDKRLRNVSVICLDRHGNVFICGSDSHNVLEISGDGTKNRLLLENFNSFTGQNSIIYHPMKEQFVITCTPSPWDMTAIAFKVFHLNG